MTADLGISVSDRVRHELAKPRANVKMFLEVFPQISDRPEEVERWKANILRSFETAESAVMALVDEAGVK
jgi:hypothetical protein